MEFGELIILRCDNIYKDTRSLSNLTFHKTINYTSGSAGHLFFLFFFFQFFFFAQNKKLSQNTTPCRTSINN